MDKVTVDGVEFRAVDQDDDAWIEDPRTKLLIRLTVRQELEIERLTRRLVRLQEVSDVSAITEGRAEDTDRG